MSILLNQLIGEICRPKPVINVFEDLYGIYLATVIDPVTRQPIYGMSKELFYRLDNQLLRETGKTLNVFADIKHFTGAAAVRFPVNQRINANVTTFASSDSYMYTFELVPVKVEL